MKVDWIKYDELGTFIIAVIGWAHIRQPVVPGCIFVSEDMVPQSPH